MILRPKPTYLFYHFLYIQEPDRVEEMVTITTTQGKSLTLTHDHLVKVSTDDKQNWRYLFSEKLQSGMHVMITQEDGTSEIDTVKTVAR